MAHRHPAPTELEGRRRSALTGCLLAVGLAFVVGIATLGYRVVTDLMDGPRDMDASELEPLIAGTEILEEPYVDCPQGREPIGDCVAVVRVGPRTQRPVVDVIADNAADEGFAMTTAGSAFLLQASSDDRCLSVAAARGSSATSHPGSVRVYLGWC